MPRTKLDKHSTRETRPEKPKRAPVGGFRDKLSVSYKDGSHRDEFYSRWVLDTTESGPRILEFLAAGYEFVPSDATSNIGETHITVTENVGSIVRRPAGGDGKFLYLMRLPMEYYLEDLERKAEQVDNTEEALAAPSSLKEDIAEKQVYGDISITRKTN